MAVLTRSAYLDRLRRAFLLRVHPDRFRNHSPGLRHQQAQLVQALSNRMSQSDFVHWASQQPVVLPTRNNNHKTNHNHNNGCNNRSSFSYALEQRDGSLFRATLELNSNRSVEDILADMTTALEKCGAGGTLPALPRSTTTTTTTTTQFQRSHSGTDFTTTSQSVVTTQQKNGGGRGVYDTTCNVISNQGRNLLHFVQHEVDVNEIAARKLARTHAQAAALAVRRLYQFQAVDATTLGWSSATVAVLLQKLLEVHQEHPMNVSSFYPLRLIFSPFDQVEEQRHFSNDKEFSALDIYGGVLRLHPAATPLQWLQQLRQVTPDSLEQVQRCRLEVEQYKGLIGSRHNWKLIKGFSCKSSDYFDVLQELCRQGNDNDGQSSPNNNNNAHALAPEPVIVTVEVNTACHRQRPTLTPEGTIQISKEMCRRPSSSQQKNPSILQALTRLTETARQRRAEYMQQQEDCRTMAKAVQWQLGLPKAVFRQGVVRQSDFLSCLYRMQDMPETESLKAGLRGNALGIAGSGHFCHLADDGSVIIPHDWH